MQGANPCPLQSTYKENRDMKCNHQWNKETGIRIPAQPHRYIKSRWERACEKCGQVEIFDNGPIFFGWFSKD